jgi:gamma-glutamyltranspeptidase/glutathione hydrolase
VTRRLTAASDRWMVATSHPLAVRAAVGALEEGGSAVDAAVAASAVLTVVDPVSTGIGGDMFALVWPRGAERPEGLAAAGPAPSGLSVETLRAAGFERIPEYGPWTITVPGAVGGWTAILERHGRLGVERLLAPAIDLAERGFRIARFVAEEWTATAEKVRENEAAAALFLPGGRPPAEGESFAVPDLGKVLRLIAEEGPDTFYRGEVAERIGAAVEEAGGPLSAEDLERWAGPTWVEPLRGTYAGVDVYELPPPGQGIIVLEALGIYEGLEKDGTAAEDHAAIEAIKLAFADAHAHVADPEVAHVPTAGLLSPEHLQARRSEVSDRAIKARAGFPSDTVYLAVVDGDGMGCSLIQSLYEGFGSGVVVPGTGIALQNRGAGFVLDDDHPNRPEPGKRPYHTIIPAMLGRSEKLVGSLGVVGGFMQPQGQLQILRNIYERGLDPQAALDAPRFRFVEGRRVGLELGYDARVVEDLTARGHEIEDLPRFQAGGAQLVLCNDGRFLGASDPRKDGYAGDR